VFIAMDDVSGVSGTIDGGAGSDLYVHALRTTGTVTLGALKAANFEQDGVRALGSGTVATIAAATPVASDVYLSGDGSIINKATINGSVIAGQPYFDAIASTTTLASFHNQGTIRSFSGSTQRFANGGAIGLDTLEATAVAISQAGALDFSNSGQITNAPEARYGGFYYPYYSYYSQPLPAVSLDTQDAQTILNSGQITGGLAATANTAGLAQPITAVPTIGMTNTGTITGGTLIDTIALDLATRDGAGSALAAVTLTNSGTIQTRAVSGIGVALTASNDASKAGQTAVVLNNSGTIRANGGGTYTAATTDPYHARISFTDYSAGVSVGGTAVTKIAVTNAAGGVIEATGAKSVALLSFDGDLTLANAGAIRGGGGTSLDTDDALTNVIGSPYLAGAIQTLGGNASISNTGTITGSIALGGGSDTVENRGTITGNVFLGAGDDGFLEQANAILTGTVDAGEGNDTLTIDATGGGTVNGDQFVNFERFNQTGTGNVSYLGNFRFDTISLSGGAVTVAAGQMLSSNGPTTLTGSDAAETVLNNGTIVGSVALGGGNDQLVNNGAILGSVSLGAGDDQFVEGVGSRVTGTVDGGAGNDLYTVMLAGNRAGIGQRTGFERLGVQGSGTLTMTLDQDFQSVALGGTNLNLSLAGRSVDAVTGSDAAETLAVDGDIASVSLGGGDDTLALGAARASGNYDGGTGNNTLRFTAAGPVTLAGTATNFGNVSLAGNALTVTGTLGSADTALAFGAGNQSLTIARGGALAGTIDLGDGDDSFRLAAGATLIGTVDGGAGNDTATIELAGTRTLNSRLLGFETLATEGTGPLSIAAPVAFTTVNANTDIAIVATGSLTATQVRFGADDNRLTIAGRFAGSVDGGAGVDTLAVSGGSEASPILFGTISNVESYTQSGGFARVQAGSIITAPQIVVHHGATFGSAGTVSGNVLIAGTLSPGASPGTMTVNGNVTLASGSTSVFELSPTVSDKLVVNGAVAIGSGSTLQLVTSGTLRPGTSYTLITATNGITGGYTTVLKPTDLFGFIVQRVNEIDLLGEFIDPGNLGAQVGRSISYTNRTLQAQAPNSTLFEALPALLTGAGASNPQAFARLTPEPYASAIQMSVDNALVLVDAARGPAFAAAGEAPRAYTFASALGQWHRLGEDVGAGTSAAHTQGYGFLGGIGYGEGTWSVGAFGGYLNNRQTVGALAARTKADGAVAGVQGRLRSAGGVGLNASVIYDGSRATTSRVLPVGSALGDYGLHSWIGDVKASYEIGLPGDWVLTPQFGVTYLRVTRSGVAETGNSPFALTVARNRHVAGFADGAVAFGRGETPVASFRPFVSFGVRYQIEGRRTDAVAGYAGGDLDLEALGARRTRLVGTASGGISYRLKNGLDIFATASSQTGSDDNQESVSSGVRLRF
jgi:uncharacterized protein with beta-barrel porin domain